MLVSTRNDDLPSIKKIALLILVGFCLMNHVVRALAAGSFADAAPTIATVGIPDLGSLIVGSLNEMRIWCGSVVDGAENLCPGKTGKYCNGLLYGVKVVLGVH